MPGRVSVSGMLSGVRYPGPIPGPSRSSISWRSSRSAIPLGLMWYAPRASSSVTALTFPRSISGVVVAASAIRLRLAATAACSDIRKECILISTSRNGPGLSSRAGHDAMARPAGVWLGCFNPRCLVAGAAMSFSGPAPGCFSDAAPGGSVWPTCGSGLFQSQIVKDHGNGGSP